MTIPGLLPGFFVTMQRARCYSLANLYRPHCLPPRQSKADNQARRQVWRAHKPALPNPGYKIQYAWSSIPGQSAHCSELRIEFWCFRQCNGGLRSWFAPTVQLQSEGRLCPAGGGNAGRRDYNDTPVGRGSFHQLAGLTTTPDVFAIWGPATKQLSIPAVTVGSKTHYNVVIKAPGLASIGQVIGADSF